MSKRWVGNAKDRKFSYARTKQWQRDHVPYACCKGKHIVVTGGCSGIGLELAKEAIYRDAKAVSLIDLVDGEKTVSKLEDEAADGLSAVFVCKVAAFKADVSNFDQIKQAIAECEAFQGPVDVICANAGIGPCGMFLEEGVEHWETVNRINYLGVVYTLKAVVPGMAQRNSGHIIVTSSSGSFMGAAGISAYCASKHAVRGFMDSLRLELINTDIKMHMACPGFVNTSMIRRAQKEASETVRKLKKAFVPKMLTAEQVAKYTWKAVNKGHYVIGSPDTGGNWLIGSSLSASSPRYFPTWLEFFMAPLFLLLHMSIRRAVEASTSKILAAAAQNVKQE